MFVSFFLGRVYFLESCFCGEEYDFVTNYILYVIIYLIYVYCIYIYIYVVDIVFFETYCLFLFKKSNCVLQNRWISMKM